MEQIKAAVIGLGRIASLLESDAKREKPCTHAGAIAASPDTALAAGADTDGERRRLFAETWGVPVYENAAEMLRAHKPGILVVATHPDSHYRYCRLARDEGVPVVICEKPLAESLREARKIKNLATDFTIIVNHERRYSADYIKAKTILKSGRLGEILSVRCVLYMGKKTRLIDTLWHDGTHLADALMFLTGGTLRHRKSAGARLSSRAGTAWLEGEILLNRGNIPFILEAGAGRDHLVFELEFSCSQGRLKIGNGVFEVEESDESPYAEKFRSLKKTEDSFIGKTGYFANMLADAVACYRESGRRPESSASDAFQTVRYLSSF
jgi:predicted dehydrogenase